MKPLRIIASVLFGLLSCFAGLLTYWSTSSNQVQQTIANSKLIDASFKEARAYIDAHLRRNGYLPSKEQFDNWASSFPPKPYTPNGIQLDLPPYTQDFIVKHGNPPENGYVLSYWRGEWEESYISWSNRSSLVFSESDYFIFGGPKAQAILGASFVLALAIIAFKLWPPKRNAA